MSAQPKKLESYELNKAPRAERFASANGHSVSGGTKSAAAKETRVLQAWREEVEHLRSQSFRTVDEASAAIVEGVVRRVGPSPGLSNFLDLLIKTDPELRDSIANIFSIPRSA